MALGTTVVPAYHQALTAAPLVSLCADGLRASPAMTGLKGKEGCGGKRRKSVWTGRSSGIRDCAMQVILDQP